MQIGTFFVRLSKPHHLESAKITNIYIVIKVMHFIHIIKRFLTRMNHISYRLMPALSKFANHISQPLFF